MSLIWFYIYANMWVEYDFKDIYPTVLENLSYM